MVRRDFLNYVKGLSSLACFSVASKVFAQPLMVSKGGKLGFNLTLDGFFAQESSEQLNGYKMAVQHINEGGGLVSEGYFSNLDGKGLLSQKVNYVIKNAGGGFSSAKRSAYDLVNNHGVQVLLGGSSSEETLAHRKVASDGSIICMDGVSHSDTCSTKSFNEMGFSLFLDNTRSAKLITKALERDLVGPQKIFHLCANYEWSRNQKRAFDSFFNKNENWSTVGKFVTGPVFDFEEAKILKESPSIIVLNVYGEKLVQVLSKLKSSQVFQNYIKENEVSIVVPLMTSLLRDRVGHETLKGVYTSLQWEASIFKDRASKSFVNSFVKSYGKKPSEAAYIGYLQLLSYANAVSGAKSYSAKKVRDYLLTYPNKLFSYSRHNHRSDFYGVAVKGSGSGFIKYS